MKFQLQVIFKHIVLTYITQLMILVAFLYVYRLIGNRLGAEAVGQYALAKRAVSLLSPVLLLGFAMGMPRYIAMSRDKQQRSAHLQAGFVAVLLALVFLICMCLFRESFAKLLLGTAEYANLILPLALLLAGFILHSLVYSFFRGRLFVKTFNTLQILNLALVPLAALVLAGNISIDNVLILIGSMNIVVSLVFLSFSKALFVRTERSQLMESLKDLLRYSLPRIPGSFALSGFFSLGPILAAHFASVEDAGYLSISQSLLSMAGTAIAPIGLVLLPKVSRMIMLGREDRIREHVNYLIGASIQLSVFIAAQAFIFADSIIHYWLGPQFLEAVPLMQIASCSIFFYLFYRTVGSILDATRVRPINAINLFISLGFSLLVAGVLVFMVDAVSPIIGLSIAFASGLTSLGILSYVSIRRLYSGKLRKDVEYFLIATVISAVMGGTAVLAKPFLILGLHYLVCFEILSGMIYLLILWLLRTDWLRQLPQILLSKGG